MDGIKFSKQELLSLLAYIVKLIENDDSFYGHIEYSRPLDGSGDKDVFTCKAIFREGNSKGQGSISTIY